jgi:hypothetical protein
MIYNPGPMKRSLLILLLLVPARAQGPVTLVPGKHSFLLNWAAPVDAVAGTSYNVYRVKATCPADPTTISWSKVSSTTALSYTDTNVTPGPWCYYVTQVQSGVESAPSNLAGARLPPNAKAKEKEK